VELGDNITNAFLLGEQAAYSESSIFFSVILFVYTLHFTY
jgi:hypothetical protein